MVCSNESDWIYRKWDWNVQFSNKSNCFFFVGFFWNLDWNVPINLIGFTGTGIGIGMWNVSLNLIGFIGKGIGIGM